MINYVNIVKKILVNRNNGLPSLQFIVDYDTYEDVKFQFINNINQIQTLDTNASYYFAGGTKDFKTLIFLSSDYTIEENVLTFTVDTYTQQYLDNIKKKNTSINIEIGYFLGDEKVILLRDQAVANPRVYKEGVSPTDLTINYYSKDEADAKFADKIAFEADVANLSANYWTKQETAAAIANIQTMDILVVQELPPIEDAQEYTLYLAPSSDQQSGNVYDEYLVINHQFEKIGSTAIDMSNYVEKSISGGIPSDYISWKSASNKNMLNIGGTSFKWGDSTAATKGEFYVYGNTTELRGRSVNIGWSGDSNIKHGGIAQNTPLGFVIQDGNGIISGAADVTTLSGASLNNALPITGAIIPVAESTQETLMETKLSDNTQIYKVTNGSGGRGTYIYVGAANAGSTHLNFSGRSLNSDVNGYISLNTPDLRLNNNNLKVTLHNNVVFDYANNGLNFTFPSGVIIGDGITLNPSGTLLELNGNVNTKAISIKNSGSEIFSFMNSRIACGYNNSITCDYGGVALGYQNNVTWSGYGTLTLGNGNKLSNANRGVLIVGSNNEFSTGGFGVGAIGKYLKNTYNTITVIGQYNIDTDAYFVVGNGVDNDNRSNCFVINRNGDVDSSGALKCAGDKLEEAPSTLIITPMQGVVYKHTLEENDEEITFQTPTSGYSMTCELWLTQPSTALSGLTFTNTILWDDGSGKHASTNAMPEMTDADTLYALVIRYDGEDWLGSLAYSKEIQGE